MISQVTQYKKYKELETIQLKKYGWNRWNFLIQKYN